jgi:hypothetical protein
MRWWVLEQHVVDSHVQRVGFVGRDTNYTITTSQAEPLLTETAVALLMALMKRHMGARKWKEAGSQTEEDSHWRLILQAVFKHLSPSGLTCKGRSGELVSRMPYIMARGFLLSKAPEERPDNHLKFAQLFSVGEYFRTLQRSQQLPWSDQRPGRRSGRTRSGLTSLTRGCTSLTGFRPRRLSKPTEFSRTCRCSSIRRPRSGLLPTREPGIF